MSVFSKALTLVFLWLDPKLIGKYAKVKMFPALTIAGQLILLSTSTDITAYFNSFYQETASLFCLFVLVSVVHYQSWPGLLAFLFCYLSCS